MGRAPRALLLLLFCTTVLAVTPAAPALETDQFTVPNGPLPDIGPELDVYVAGTVWDVVQTLNTRAADEERAARRSVWPWRDYHRARASRLRSDDLLAQRVYDNLAGPGLPECRIEVWAREHPFRCARDAGVANVGFELPLSRCVYGDSLFDKPLLLAFLSPTVNVHGTYLGVDKLGHLFQHGFYYLQEYRQAESDGEGAAAATARAVRLGVDEEQGFYGALTTGVYSNADLAANYSGLKFYLNLTRPVRIDGRTLPPMLLRDRKGNWYFNPSRQPDRSLRLLVDDHFNEALNPSRFEWVLRDTVRDRLRPRAERLLDFYDTTPERERERMHELATWHGEPYGHSGFSSRLVTIADNCPPRRGPAGGEAVVVGARTPTLSPAVDPGHDSASGAAGSDTRTSPARLSIR
jgi:hypothetical protein